MFSSFTYQKNVCQWKIVNLNLPRTCGVCKLSLNTVSS